MFTNFEVKPNEGFGDIDFGMDMDSFVEKYGEPEEVDDIDEDEEEYNTTILHYWQNGVSLFFIGLTNPVLAGLETDHAETELYGEKIMGKPKEFILNLMAENGNTDFDEDIEELPEEEEQDLRVSFEESMMDFFFRDNQLVYMNFGVFVDEGGNIVKV